MLVLSYRLMASSFGSFLAGACIELCSYPRLHWKLVWERCLALFGIDLRSTPADPSVRPCQRSSAYCELREPELQRPPNASTPRLSSRSTASRPYGRSGANLSKRTKGLTQIMFVKRMHVIMIS